MTKQKLLDHLQELVSKSSSVEKIKALDLAIQLIRSLAHPNDIVFDDKVGFGVSNEGGHR